MRYYIVLLVLSTFVSCQNFKGQMDREVVARVNNTYLYRDDLKNIVPKDTPKTDSISIVANFINTWATRQLLIDQAKLNLTEKKIREFDDLVESYQSTLYVNAYKNAVINKSIDMEIKEQDFELYYNQNLKNFNLNEELVKLRYLHLPSNYGNIIATQKQLNRFKEEDVEELIERKLDYLGYSFNDSVWVKLNQVVTKIPVLKTQPKTKFLEAGKFNRFKDSTGVYLMKVMNVLRPNETAPLEYIKPTIRQIILNKRKLELIKKIEKDITRDAVENKQFEIYE